MRVLEVYWSHALSIVCEVALRFKVGLSWKEIQRHNVSLMLGPTFRSMKVDECQP